MASKDDDDDSRTTKGKSGSASESKQTPAANTPPLTNRQLRDNANAPTSTYPPPSTNEYAPNPARQLPLDAQGHPRNPAFTLQSMVPPIVTLTGRPTRPPRAPNRNDERCIMYCTQTAARRSLGAQPICKTICWRRLFPQDLTFVEVDDDENEGKGSDQTSGADDKTQKLRPGLFGFDGRFVYFGRSRFRAKDRMDSMSQVGLSVDTSVDDIVPKNSPGAKDTQYMEFLRRYHYSTQIEVGPLPATIYLHMAERAERLFAPFIRTSTVYLKSFEREGIQERFAKRVLEKTQNGETWALAKKIGSKLWENISNGGGNGSGPVTPR